MEYYPKAEKDQYGDAKQSFCTLCNWQCLKALVIGSNTLPVVEEYLPISHYDGFLTHYETEEYKKRLNALGMPCQKDQRSQFKKDTHRVLTVYYPLSSQPGDTRSYVIHMMNNIEDEHYIEMTPVRPIRKFDIWVQWLDTYGNLHPLYLQPGLACDIRLCFFKKKTFGQPPEGKRPRKPF